MYVCVCVCVLDEMAALLVRLSRDVLGARVCLSAAHVALNHKTSLGGVTSRLAPLKSRLYWLWPAITRE